MGDIDLQRVKKVSGSTDRRIAPSGALEYFPVKRKNLALGYPLPCALFLPVVRQAEQEARFEKLFDEGQPYSKECEMSLLERKIEVLHIVRECMGVFSAYLENLTKTYVNSPDISSTEKNQLLYNDAEFLIERVFHEPDSVYLVDDVSRWSKVVGDLFVKEEITPSVLCRIFSKDYTTFTHSIQVALLGMAFSVFLGWEGEQTAEFGLGGLFHDVGKIWIDDRVLQKPGALSPEEFQHVRNHPHLGYEHLTGIGNMPPGALQVVLHHHETTDGKGYPSGLKSDEIHTFARVGHLVDVYDALTSRRPYKGPLDPVAALKLMHEEMRHSFDLDLFRRFIRFLGK